MVGPLWRTALAFTVAFLIIWVECMRCLEEMTLTIDVERTLLIRLVETVSLEEDDVDSISLPANAHEIDMPLFPSLLYPCNKVYLHANEHGDKDVFRL